MWGLNIRPCTQFTQASPSSEFILHIFMCLKPYYMHWSHVKDKHNIIQVHNNVLWDWQYSTKYSQIFPTFSLNVANIQWNIVVPIEHCYGSEYYYEIKLHSYYTLVIKYNTCICIQRHPSWVFKTHIFSSINMFNLSK